MGLAMPGSPGLFTTLGPTSTPGGFSGQSFGAPGLPFGFGFPSSGDPLFYFTPAASSFMINRLLGFANGSAVNINIGPTPSHLGLGGLLLGQPFFGTSGSPGAGPFGSGTLGSFGGGANLFNTDPMAGLGGLGAGAGAGAAGGLGGLGAAGGLGGAPGGTGNPLFPHLIGDYSGLGAGGQATLGGLGGGFPSSGLGAGGMGMPSFPNYPPIPQSPPPQQSGFDMKKLLSLMLIAKLLKK